MQGHERQAGKVPAISDPPIRSMKKPLRTTSESAVKKALHLWHFPACGVVWWCAVLGGAFVARGQGTAPEPAIPSGLIEPPRAVQPNPVVRPAPVPARPPGQAPAVLTRYNGNYYVIPERCDSIILVIDDVTKRINPFARGVARNRLNSMNPPCTTVHIQIIDARTVSIGTDQWPTWNQRLDGTPTRWRRNHQEQYGVTLRLSPGGVLEQRFVGTAGERINRYFLTEGGKTLEMEVLVMSPKLPQPIHYTLRFARI